MKTITIENEIYTFSERELKIAKKRAIRLSQKYLNRENSATSIVLDLLKDCKKATFEQLYSSKKFKTKNQLYNALARLHLANVIKKDKENKSTIYIFDSDIKTIQEIKIEGQANA